MAEGQTKLLSPVNDQLRDKAATKPIKDGWECDATMMAEADSDKDKNKQKIKRSRELGDLGENAILAARLRSASGKVYSTSMVLDQKIPDLPPQLEKESLGTLQEEDVDEMLEDSKFNKLVNMITRLQTSVDGIQKEIRGQQVVSLNLRSDLESVEESVSNNSNEIHSLHVELKEYKFQLKLASNMLIRQEQQIEILNRKVTEIQQREMNANIVITGLDENPRENCIQKFNNFVQHKLEIQELLPAKQAFRLGNGKNRPMVVELRHPETDKRKIFQNVSTLKGKTNGKGSPYFIADHLPEELNENRRRANDLISANRKKPENMRSQMEIKKGQLSINGEPYVKSILPPKVKQILKPSEEMWDLAEEVDLVKGKEKKESKLHFVAFAAAVDDEKEIQAAYLKVRTKFADATHVVCAYRLRKGDSTFLEDYADDGEFGAGRTILKLLVQEKLSNVVVFMVHYYGGTHLGQLRFTIFQDVSLSALTELQKRLQEIEKEEKEKELAEAKRQEAQRNAFPSEASTDINQMESWEVPVVEMEKRS